MFKEFLCIISFICLLNIFYNYNINASAKTNDEPANLESRSIKDALAALLPPELVEEQPTVLVALLIRNKAHVLPLFFTYLESLNYPKDRITLWIRSDHNNDSTIEQIELWLNHTSALYHDVNVELDATSSTYDNESTPFDWPEERFKHLIQLKEAALLFGKKIWADFVFFLDADVLLTSPDTLKHLTSLNLPIVAPMLFSESMYSNFWCGMTADYYYLRTDEYREIYHVRKEGTFQVRMIYSAVLINLRHMAARYVTFDRQRLLKQQRSGMEWITETQGIQCRPYDGPEDDIIVFAISANCSQIPLFVNNEISYGYIIPPLDRQDALEVDIQQVINVRANIVHDYGAAAEIAEYWLPHISYPEKQTLTLDRIYMINLERRAERRDKMELLFKELGLDVEYFAAIDGKTLNTEAVEALNIKILPGYEDPYHHRQMTMGEIGCFLSHYRIWERIVELGLKEVLVLEDDIRFEPNFRYRAISVLEQARKTSDFDLIYFGRKRLKDEIEPLVQNAPNLVHVGYSYWTLGYVITLNGAQKLLDAKPLENLLPVDEFLPIMFHRHPNETWSSAFSTKKLLAFSASPLLLFPTHYTGDYGYISDTEDSELTPEQLYASATASKHVNNDPRLKSDRQVQFPNDPTQLQAAEVELKLPKTDINDLTDFGQLNVGKAREEL